MDDCMGMFQNGATRLTLDRVQVFAIYIYVYVAKTTSEGRLLAIGVPARAFNKPRWGIEVQLIAL